MKNLNIKALELKPPPSQTLEAIVVVKIKMEA